MSRLRDSAVKLSEVQTDRRGFLKGAAAVAMSISFSGFALAEGIGAPAMVRAFVGDTEPYPFVLEPGGTRWSGGGVEVDVVSEDGAQKVVIHAPKVMLQRVQLRWTMRTPEGTRVLGDAWERSYGDLAWLPLQAERVLPWYCMIAGRDGTLGLGVRTDAAAFAFWQVDAEGVSLWLDTRNGGNGVSLGDRALIAATIVMVRAPQSISTFEATRALCRRMVVTPMVAMRGGNSMHTVIGSNDWYYAYGQNKPANLLRDAELMQELAPKGHRPFTVIDDGYQNPKKFPDMAGLASAIDKIGPVPGIWIRPIRPPKGVNEQLLLPKDRWGIRTDRFATHAYDPTIAEANKAVLDVVREATGWGFKLLKHDFTTYELLGQWGNEMGASPTKGNWHFNDRTRTNAEILATFYQDLRVASGQDVVLQGCNTVGHLSVGLFDTSRIGDDVSGKEWERTRKMGVNTLAFRLPQHGEFFCVDADCIPLTREVDWSHTKRWLQLVASTRSSLIVSADPSIIGVEQKAALREAFALAVSDKAHSEPLDWMESRTPIHWSGQPAYRWDTPEGASPFAARLGAPQEMITA
jgi:alpha-galactosidase